MVTTTIQTIQSLADTRADSVISNSDNTRGDSLSTSCFEKLIANSMQVINTQRDSHRQTMYERSLE
jgi:hypothetical protein